MKQLKDVSNLKMSELPSKDLSKVHSKEKSSLNYDRLSLYRPEGAYAIHDMRLRSGCLSERDT